MDFTEVAKQVAKDGLAARRFEQEGHGSFRDCVIVGRNARVLFQRFSYGEAASLVFEMWAKEVLHDGSIVWDDEKVYYSKKNEAPSKLCDVQSGVPVFDGGKKAWRCAAELKLWPAGGLGRFKMMFARLKQGKAGSSRG